jgi:hypothetical protein
MQNLITPQATNQSKEWYREQILNARKNFGKPSTMLNEDARFVGQITIGRMYLFRYDPKLKEKLPIYDTNPLVFPFNTASGGFLGINFHYLPPGFRLYLIEALEPHYVRTGNKLQDVDKIKASWQILNQVAGVGALNGAVKHYLMVQMRSSFMEIPYGSWRKAVSLPLQNFVRKK